jgi:hypothetical protein
MQFDSIFLYERPLLRALLYIQACSPIWNSELTSLGDKRPIAKPLQPLLGQTYRKICNTIEHKTSSGGVRICKYKLAMEWKYTQSCLFRRNISSSAFDIFRQSLIDATASVPFPAF